MFRFSRHLTISDLLGLVAVDLPIVQAMYRKKTPEELAGLQASPEQLTEQVSDAKDVDASSQEPNGAKVENGKNPPSSDIPTKLKSEASAPSTGPMTDSDYLPEVEAPPKASDLFPSYYSDFYKLELKQQGDFTKMVDSLDGITNDVVLNSIYFVFPFIKRMVEYKEAESAYKEYNRLLAQAKNDHIADKKLKDQQAVDEAFKIINRYRETSGEFPLQTDSGKHIKEEDTSRQVSTNTVQMTDEKPGTSTSSYTSMDGFFTTEEKDARARQVKLDSEYAMSLAQSLDKPREVKGSEVPRRRSNDDSVDRQMMDDKNSQLIDLRNSEMKKPRLSTEREVSFDQRSFFAGDEVLKPVPPTYSSLNPESFLNRRISHASDVTQKIEVNVTRQKIALASCMQFLNQPFGPSITKDLHKFVSFIIVTDFSFLLDFLFDISNVFKTFKLHFD